MGAMNPRAICPDCGGKIHTQQKPPFGRRGTGGKCQHCGTALSGQIGPDNVAVREGETRKGFWRTFRENLRAS